MMATQEEVRAALIDALREAAEAATDGATRVTVCADGVRLRAARQRLPVCVAPTEVEIDLSEDLLAEVEVGPEYLPSWAEGCAAALVERVLRKLDAACATGHIEIMDHVELSEFVETLFSPPDAGPDTEDEFDAAQAVYDRIQGRAVEIIQGADSWTEVAWAAEALADAAMRMSDASWESAR